MSAPTAEYRVQLVGDEALRKALEQFNEISSPILTRYMNRAVLPLEAAIVRETPVNEGTLRSGWFHDVSSIGVEVQGVVANPHEYALWVELGRTAGSRMPPRAPIKRWCQLVLGDGSLWFVVARAIAAKGIEPAAMAAKGLNQTKDRIRELLSEARDQIVQAIAYAAGGST